MGAWDDGGMTRATPIKTQSDYAPMLEKANITLQRDTAALDKVLANPRATVKQINSALNKLNKSTDAQINTLLKYLSAPTSAISETTKTEESSPLQTATVIDPEPITPSAVPISTPTSTTASPVVTPPVKTAPIDTVLFDNESVPIEVMTDLIFENIGGHELINVARNDIVNGQQVVYQPIKNLSSIQQQYNPNNILSLQSTSDKYFANFSIKLENKIPNPGTGPNGSYVYLDEDTGNLVIEAINLELDEQIEAEITVSGTIYEAEFGESTS